MKKLHDNYRIVVTTEKSGKQWYQVEKRVFWFFWVGKMLAKRSQSEAEAIIDYLIDRMKLYQTRRGNLPHNQ